MAYSAIKERQIAIAYFQEKSAESPSLIKQQKSAKLPAIS
jgi:hypothetical protein